VVQQALNGQQLRIRRIFWDQPYQTTFHTIISLSALSFQAGSQRYELRTSPIPGPPKTLKISEVLPPLSLMGRIKSSPRPLSAQSVVNTSIRLLAALPPLRTTRRLRVDIADSWRLPDNLVRTLMMRMRTCDGIGTQSEGEWTPGLESLRRKEKPPLNPSRN
jgi:hypothetical protein